MLFLTFIIGCWIGCAGGIFLAGLRSRVTTRNATHSLANSFATPGLTNNFEDMTPSSFLEQRAELMQMRP